MRAPDRYSKLSESEIIQTLSRLRSRVAERFPESGLSKVTDELLLLAGDASGTAAYLQRPNWPVRAGVGVAIVVMGAILAAAASAIRVSHKVGGIAELAQGLEAAVNDLVFLGVAIWFLLTIEGRMKRRRALGTLHQLRSVVHIVDMHQLTKDPERLLSMQPDTASSPERRMSAPELGRYLDYCSELVSLASKVAALLVQRFNDPVVLSAVNEIETLATGLAGKVWQKITLLERAMPREREASNQPRNGG